VEPSYKPGVTLGDLNPSLPVRHRGHPRSAAGLRKADPGYSMHDAVLTGIETRTSSPIRIKRDDHTLQSLNTKGCTRPVKGPVMPAASCRRPSTASAWPKRWRWIWWRRPDSGRPAKRRSGDPGRRFVCGLK
jgi:hypothetical protein